MSTATLLSPLLLALAVGIAAPAPAHAADNPNSLPPQACQSVRAELDAVATHLREARADLAGIFAGEGALDLHGLTDAWFGDETQATMRALVERLKAPRG